VNATTVMAMAAMAVIAASADIPRRAV